MIAAIYARKSVETEKGESIENQLQLCKETGVNIGVTEFLYYTDEGFSGGNTNRPKFKQMMKDAKTKKFSMLICYRLDRISRNVADFSSTLETLQKYNIDFVSIKEHFDTSTPIGRAMVYIASVFAQLERETIAERIKDNMLELAKTGRWLGGIPPLGFKSEVINYKDSNGRNKKMYRLILVKDEIEIVRLIFNLYLEKKGFPSVASYLCAHNYKGKNGGEFSRRTVEQIIKNPVYTYADKNIYGYFKKQGAIVCGDFNGKSGLITYNKRLKGKKENPISTWIIAPGKHEGIIASDLWIKCQNINLLNSQKLSPRSATGSKFLLSGLLICGECGSSMSSWSRNNPRSGKYERYYRCNLKNRASTRCGSKMLNADKAEELVLSNIKGITIEQLIEVCDKTALKEKSTDSTFKKEIKLKKQKENNVRAIQGLIRKLAFLEDSPDIISEFQKEITKLKLENKSLEEELYALKNIPKYTDSNLSLNDEINNSLENMKKLFKFTQDVDKKRSCLLQIVDYILWDSNNNTLQVNLFNSTADVPIGGVRRNNRNLCLRDTTR